MFLMNLHQMGVVSRIVINARQLLSEKKSVVVEYVYSTTTL